jgi:hypothetical protein
MLRIRMNETTTALPFSEQCAALHFATCSATGRWDRDNTAPETAVLEKLHASGYEIVKRQPVDLWRGTR